MVSGYIRKPRVFNPRLREGGDNAVNGFKGAFKVFNPRLREGGDPLKLIASCASLFSIHASAKEATLY